MENRIGRRVARCTITVGNIVAQVRFMSDDANQATFHFAVTGIPSPVQKFPPFGSRSLYDLQEIGTEPSEMLVCGGFVLQSLDNTSGDDVGAPRMPSFARWGIVDQDQVGIDWSQMQDIHI